MSAAFLDYVDARHEVITAVLGMVTVQYRRSGERAPALSLTAAQAEVGAAAGRLAEAVDALGPGSRPVGWGLPPVLSGDVTGALRRVIKAALRCLAAQYAFEPADADADSEYSEDQLALACRNLTAALKAQKVAAS